MDRQAFVLAGWIIAVFAVVGIGLGVAGFVTVGLASGALGGTASSAVVAAFFAGPLVAMVTGLIAGSILWQPLDAVVGGGLGSFVGFYLFAFMSVPVIVVAAQSAGQPSPGIGALVVPMLVMGVPTGIVGTISALVGNQMQ